jgi:hypothetical protein
VRRVLLALAACAAAARAAAAVSVAAELDRTRVTADEQLVLSVTVSGDQASVPEPKIPPLEAFSLYDSGKSQSISFVNGRVASSVVYTYVLTPRSVGKFKIPPITADGAAQPTAPIDIEILKPGAAPPVSAGAPAPGQSAAPPAGPIVAPPVGSASSRGDARGAEVMVTASLDKTRALVNEQVTLTVRFLYSENSRLLGNQQYEAPAMTGFLSEDLPPVRNGSTVIDGRSYYYSEVKTALFPIQPGRLSIGPAAVHTQIARRTADPFGGGLFDNFFVSAQNVILHSDPLTLQVDPPPPGKPADFSGLVGSLAARASADKLDAKAGDAVTLTVEISGSGNVKSVPEPAKPDLPSLRFFETETSAVTDKKADRVGGSKTFKTVVVPRVSGDVTIPPFAFSYYDPQLKSYARAATAPISLRVAPGPAGGAAASAPTAPALGLTAVDEDIRYLKTAPESSPLSAALARFADLGPWHALPLAALALSALGDWRRRAADADPRGRRAREARGRAERRLKAAAALPDAEAGRAAALVGEALAAFVADKLDVPAAGLALKSALEGLRALRRPPEPQTLEKLRAAWEEADLRRFAPGVDGADARRFAGDVAALIAALDQELGR